MVASQLSSISGVALSPSKPMYSSIESSKASRRTSLIVHAKKTPFKVPKQAVKAKYDKNAKDTSTPLSAFTRKREVFAGRLAMSGFLAGTIGELLTGKGFLGQLSLQTNLPPVAVKGIVAAIVAFNVLTALNPLSETFSESNQRDVAKRPRGPTQNPKINPIENPTEFLGIDKVEWPCLDLHPPSLESS